MEDSNLRGLVDNEIVMKMGKGAGIGMAFGSVWGVVASMLCDVPQVGSTAKTQLIRTGKMYGHYAAGLAVFGATYVGVEQTLEKYRMKKDIVNGAAAGTVLGFRGGSFRTALLSGSAVALASVLMDVTGLRPADEEGKGHH